MAGQYVSFRAADLVLWGLCTCVWGRMHSGSAVLRVRTTSGVNYLVAERDVLRVWPEEDMLP